MGLSVVAQGQTAIDIRIVTPVAGNEQQDPWAGLDDLPELVAPPVVGLHQ